MVGDSDNNRKGFSGLSGLVSDLSSMDELIKPVPKAEVILETSTQQREPQNKPTQLEKERETTNARTSSNPSDTIGDENNSLGKWLLAFFAVVIFIGILTETNKIDKKPSYSSSLPPNNGGYSQASPPLKDVKKGLGLQYAKPPVGTNNILSVSQIRWCIKEGIRIETMRGIFTTNEGVDELNLMVSYYNSRCGSYRYRQGSQSRAENDVKPYRKQIVADAIEEAREISPSQFLSNDRSTGSTPKKPSAKYTKEAQQILTDLGYDPGPVDGQYGRRTADAVKAFQRDAGIPQDGWIDQDLLVVMKRVNNKRSSQPSAKVESKTLQKNRKPGNVPRNAWVSGSNWYCNSGYRKVGRECVKVIAPANAYVTGAAWYCNSGYRKVGRECVKVIVPANAYVSGSTWYCNSGYRKVGSDCVSDY
jgi:hypothetical protein